VTELLEQTNHYLSDFERLEKGGAAPAVQRLRKAALARFAELGFPGPRDEEWRFTPVAPLAKTPFRLGPADVPGSADAYRQLTHGDEPGATLLAVNAERPFLLGGSRPLPDGVLVGSLAEALEKHPQLVEPHLARLADYKRHVFVALNTAFLRDGLFVYVPPGRVVEGPIFLESLVAAFNDNAPYAWHRRCLIVLGANARATVVEQFNGLPGVAYLTNAVTEVVVGANASLDHYKVQEEGDAAFHMAMMQVQLARAARFSSHAVALGGAWVRNEVNAVFGGEGGECTLNGLYRGAGRQLVDNHTFIDHALPHCTSHELYKGILDGQARGVFNGKIFVRQDAQKTDAKQTNQTLLLSDDATINTKPQLEIYADDVKCTHGATVGQLDAEQAFYLRSRGIGADEARALLTFAFANDIIERIQVASVRERLAQDFLAARGLPPADTDEEGRS
jgi:Fe-S cluster assembly protein SufD